MRRVHYRKKSRNEASALKHPLPKYDNSEISEKIDEMIHDAKDREIMRHKLVDGLTLSQVSATTGIPYSTVRDHYYRCKKIIFGNQP